MVGNIDANTTKMIRVVRIMIMIRTTMVLMAHLITHNGDGSNDNDVQHDRNDDHYSSGNTYATASNKRDEDYKGNSDNNENMM